MKITIKSRTNLPITPSNPQTSKLSLLRHKAKQTHEDVQKFLETIDLFEKKSREVNHYDKGLKT
jgi:hypothetical protein